MNETPAARFERHYHQHLKHLKLKGLQPKTIEAYARAIRRAGAYFDLRIDALTETQLLDYFTDLSESHSWSAVKLDLYGLKFFYQHVLKKPWVAPDLIKPPRAQRLPDIVTVDEARRIFAATRVASYRVFFFTLYSLGLRLGEGLRLTVADIDATRTQWMGSQTMDGVRPRPITWLRCFCPVHHMMHDWLTGLTHCAAGGGRIAGIHYRQTDCRLRPTGPSRHDPPTSLNSRVLCLCPTIAAGTPDNGFRPYSKRAIASAPAVAA